MDAMQLEPNAEIADAGRIADARHTQMFDFARLSGKVEHQERTAPDRMPESPMLRIAGPLLGTLARIDLAVVRLLSMCASPAALRFLAITLSRWGNGAIYAVLPVFILLRLGRAGVAVVALSCINIGMLHIVYARLKRRIGRRRPFAANHDVASLLDVLDEHSFPSGHVMTLTAALIPLIYADPTVAPYCAILLGAMGWARIASGHHYPTDVIAGAAVAFATGYPLTVLWLG